jgi:hypothetical protein
MLLHDIEDVLDQIGNPTSDDDPAAFSCFSPRKKRAPPRLLTVRPCSSGHAFGRIPLIDVPAPARPH